MSEAYTDQIEGRDDLDILEEPGEMSFDPEGNLYPVAAAEAAEALVEEV